MTISVFRIATLGAAAIAAFFAGNANAQSNDEQSEPRRTRVALGPQLVPSYPGADSISLRPLVDVSRARGSEEFAFEAPDESFGFPFLSKHGFSIGPSLGFEGKRTGNDIGASLPDIDFTIEVGAFAQYQAGENFRLRAEARQGVNGHEGLVSILSADYVWRDGDRQLISIGPRITISDSNYQDAYFSVRPADSLASGLVAYDAGGGGQSVGGTVGYIRQFTPRWGVYSYAKYDRLIDDPANSPIVEQFGSRDQFSGGIALSYTFGAGL